MQTMTSDRVPDWAIRHPKSIIQKVWDLIWAPFRMVLFPDNLCEKLHITSLRGERFRVVLKAMRGRVLDIGAGDNVLVHLYKEHASGLGNEEESANLSEGVDVVDWGSDCRLIESSDNLPYEDNSFDTVTFVACINHIPERIEALREVRRILKPGGRVVITMIGRVIGEVGHRLWWYSEDKHREVEEEELMGMDEAEVLSLLKETGFGPVTVSHFVYGLNTLYVAEPAEKE